MKRFFLLTIILLLVFVFLSCMPVVRVKTEQGAELKLASVFSDNMVLQRDKEISIWGTTQPGEKIAVSLAREGVTGEKFSTKANKEGKWLVKIGPFNAGGPYEMWITSPRVVVLHNILFGDVWIASGQSNMELSVVNSNNATAEIANANYPQIRLITVPHKSMSKPQETVELSGWKECNPETIKNFSAAAYFFGRDLHQHLKVPIGLINCSWGGSSMETWTPFEALENNSEFKDAIDNFYTWKESTENPEKIKVYQEKLNKWKEQTKGEPYHKDPGDESITKGWANTDFDVNDWKTMTLPGVWETQGLDDMDGAVWFRREVDLQDEWAGKELFLSLGSIDDFDTTYFNGVKIGGIGLETPNYWMVPREYVVPATLVKSGKNVIAVRVFDHAGSGGFTASKEQMFITLKDNKEKKISLDGEWKYKVSIALQQKPVSQENNNQSLSLLYNGMLNPLIPYGIKGVIWYQGETNAPRAKQYCELSKIMITSWREKFGQGNFTFLFVQLAGFKTTWGDWAMLRESQLKTLELPNTGMAIATDIGEEMDIHPKNKQEVGRRLALTARKIAYGEDIIYSGPIYKSMVIENNKSRLSFDHIGSGLVSKTGDNLKGFIISGVDKKFVSADAKIDGDTVVVSSPKVANPIAVRYAWANYPECSLYNKEELPASPFRTDNFNES